MFHTMTANSSVSADVTEKFKSTILSVGGRVNYVQGKSAKASLVPSSKVPAELIEPLTKCKYNW